MSETEVELEEFEVTIKYKVALDKEFVQEHTDDGTGLLTAVVFAAAIKAQVGDLDGWIEITDIASPDFPTDVDIDWPQDLSVAYKADEYDIDYEGTS